MTGAIDKTRFPHIKPKILAINDEENLYNYSKKVLLQVVDSDMEDYIAVAKKVNETQSIKIVCVQHEFGLFGGEYGDCLLAFLELVTKPVVVTFHSLIPEPDERLKKVVNAISEKVSAIIVMTKTGVDILRNDYGISTPIHIVPHGIPTTSFDSQDQEKKRLGHKGRTLLVSFGLVGPGKGYENIIQALPKIVKKFPDTLYLIIGETHPVVRKNEGEKYRNFLKDLIYHHELKKHVKFYNKYLTLDELIRFLKATDIYLSPGENPNQITSGTLVYAMGCGRAAISTPFLHAKDLMQHDRGMLAKFDSPESFEKAILHLLENPGYRKKIEKEAYYYTRHMTWPNVALDYNKIFNRYLGLSEHPEMEKLPKINTAHLINMTDNFGIIQFAQQSAPDISSGYTLDDNARALLVSAMHYSKFKEYKQLTLLKTYLDYLKYVQDTDGKLYNYVDGKKTVDFNRWSEDAHGRALWALGYVISSTDIPEDLKQQAEDIFDKALAIADIKSPRAVAFIITGLYYYNLKRKSVHIQNNVRTFANHLISLFETNGKPGWQWFEPYLTYANSKLPEALLYAHLVTKKQEYRDIGLRSLRFLISKTFEKEMFIPIGQRGWYVKDNERAIYDQQPIDAAYTVQTLLLAFAITKNERYRRYAVNAFLWFLGKNSLNQVIYNEKTGGCHDGIGEGSINLNQGAESTLSYLIARLSLALM